MKKLTKLFLCLVVILAISACSIQLPISNKHVHSWDNGTITFEPTCEEEGQKTFRCSGCDELKFELVSKLAHNYSIVKHNETEHWMECVCGGKADLAAHTFDEGILNPAPTCTDEGQMVKTCTVCEYELITKVDSTGHEYETSWSNDKDNHWHAAICEHTDETKDKAPHRYDNGTITLNPSCQTEGSKLLTCLDCGYEKTEVIPVDSNAHTLDNGVVTKEATCTEEGVMTYSCACGHKETGSINKKPHVGQGDLIFDDQTHYYLCSCNAKVDEEDHSFDNGIVIDEATCTEKGTIKYSCECGYSYNDEIPTIPHTPIRTAYVIKEGQLYIVSYCECSHEESVLAADDNYEVNNEADLRLLLTNGYNAVLTADINLKASIFLTGDVEATVDLNGKTIKVDWTDTENYAEVFRADNGAVLNIKGEGTVDGGSGSYCNGAVSTSNNATINIYGGYFTAGLTEDGVNGSDLIYAKSGVINIYGGTYVATPYEGTYYTLDVNEALEVLGVINVYGGTFYKFDPANHTNDGSKYTNKVAEGYHSILDGDYYLVNKHQYDDGVVTLVPTHDTEGLKVYTCTDCGHTKEEVIPMLPKVDLSSIIFNGITVIYDGESYSIYAVNIPQEVTVTYEGNGVSEVGTHTVVAKFLDSTNTVVGQLTATIKIVQSSDVEFPWV